MVLFTKSNRSSGLQRCAAPHLAPPPSACLAPHVSLPPALAGEESSGTGVCGWMLEGCVCREGGENATDAGT